MRAEELDRMYRLEGHYWWFVARRWLMSSLLTRWGLPRDAIVLDAGSGTGGTYLALRRRWRIIGLDVSLRALELSRNRGMELLICGDVMALPLRDASVDAAVSCDVLEHLQDDMRALREMLRVVKPGGLLALTVPALPWLWSDHDEALGHLRRYTRRGLTEALQEAGWQVLWLNYTVSLLLPPIALFRVYRQWRRRSGEPRVDLFELPRSVNALLTAICMLDSWLAVRLPLPPGASLVAVARKPE